MLGPSWVALLVAIFIVAVERHAQGIGSFMTRISGRVVRFFADLTFGLYVWHEPVFGVVAASRWIHEFRTPFSRTGIAILVTAIIATIFRALVENPALKYYRAKGWVLLHPTTEAKGSGAGKSGA